MICKAFSAQMFYSFSFFDFHTSVLLIFTPVQEIKTKMKTRHFQTSASDHPLAIKPVMNAVVGLFSVLYLAKLARPSIIFDTSWLNGLVD